jgi:hypothetical protein
LICLNKSTIQGDQKIVKLTYLFGFIELGYRENKTILGYNSKKFYLHKCHLCVYEIDVQGDNEKIKFLTITEKFTKHHNKNLKQ